MNILKKIIDKLFSTTAGGVYMLLIAIAIGAATFIENDFGTSSAQQVVFKTRWFELLLLFFGISLVLNIFRFRMIRQQKWTLFVFHISMIVILLGAGVTRYVGYEGMMGIREGSSSNVFLSSETYLQFEFLSEGKRFAFSEPVLFSTLGDNHFEQSYLIAGKELKCQVKRFLPNPAETMTDDDNGVPMLKVVIAGMNGREEYLVKYRDKVNIYGTLFNFGNPEEAGAFNIKYERDSLYFMAPTAFTQMVMATRQQDTLPPGAYHPLMLRSMYASGSQRFVFGAFSPHAVARIESTAEKMTSTSSGGVDMVVSYGGEEKSLFLTGRQGAEGRPGIATFGNSSLAVSYGAKKIQLPFAIRLNDFIMERYPGTDNASSYASEVTLLDSRNNLERNQRIYMNNILNYGGYRFFQSSFDQDELGTYLSVNHDAWGTWISYIGYALLTLGMVMTFFNKNSRFLQLAENLRKMRQSQQIWAALLMTAAMAAATPAVAETQVPPAVDKEHATLFGKEVLIQDHRGRLKPMNTYTGEIMRKLQRKESYEGLSSDQIILSMAANPKDWYHVPLIKTGKHEQIRNLLGISGEMATYADFFESGGEYKLREYVRDAYNVPQRDRGVFEKELLKVDEKVNIASMVFSGRFMNVFPVPGDTTHSWMSAPDAAQQQYGEGMPGSGIMQQFYPSYMAALKSAIQQGNWELPGRMVTELSIFQQKYGGEVLISPAKVDAELLLNRLDAFNRLGRWYGLLALVFLALMFIEVFKPGWKLGKVGKVAYGLMLFCFLMHLTGLGLRWYVSGRAPWSNGYESMIYIAFTTVLAGLIFARKTFGGLAATSVLAATILMVAAMNWMDPEITPLVPVLKSYWLMIHVSLEAGSYGFLVLGAIIGMLNLIFMIFASEKNGQRVYRMVQEMTWISEMTLIGGLVMLSVGTYLGGVWANESWGRYWGWDAKETWALVSILVYSFILHMRFIPPLRGLYAFNVATLFGWASVAMTYFGVNYYLSGLHSYAAGDPVPIPPSVYWTVLFLVTVSLLAWWRYRQYWKGKPASSRIAA
jgi:cytochrome c-type biogenesis protein CcsB